MNVRNMTTSILLTNHNDKKILSIRNFSNNKNESNSVEVDNLLENKTIINFFSNNIKSIKYVKSFIETNKYRECIEIKNAGNSSLNIISEDVNKYFKDLLEYISENRIKFYEQYLFDLICKYSFDEIIFKLSNNNKNSEVDIVSLDNKKRLIYYIPYSKDEKGKIQISKQDLNLIQKTINSYFIITGSKMKGFYEEGTFEYLINFYLYTDNATIIINNNKIYYDLSLYFGKIRQEYEKELLEKRDEIFKESQVNIKKSKFKVLKNKKKDKE